MGQIIIEMPLHYNRKYRIVSHDSAEEILSKIENLIAQSNNIEDKDIQLLLADREESAGQIVEEVRQSWKRNF